MINLIPIQQAYSNIFQRQKSVPSLKVSEDGIRAYIGEKLSPSSEHYFINDNFVKHITLDKTWEGIDHRVSLLPNEFKNMVEEIAIANESLGLGEYRNVSQGEVINRENLGKSLFVNCAIKKGELFTADCFDVKSPGKGLKPYHKKTSELICFGIHVR